MALQSVFPSPLQSADLLLAPDSPLRTCRVQTLWSMSDWTAGEAMGTLNRHHATAAPAPAPEVGGLEEEEEGEKRLQAKVLLREDHCVVRRG